MSGLNTNDARAVVNNSADAKDVEVEDHMLQIFTASKNKLNNPMAQNIPSDDSLCTQNIPSDDSLCTCNGPKNANDMPANNSEAICVKHSRQELPIIAPRRLAPITYQEPKHFEINVKPQGTVLGLLRPPLVKPNCRTSIPFFPPFTKSVRDDLPDT